MFTMDIYFRFYFYSYYLESPLKCLPCRDIAVFVAKPEDWMSRFPIEALACCIGPFSFSCFSSTRISSFQTPVYLWACTLKKIPKGQWILVRFLEAESTLYRRVLPGLVLVVWLLMTFQFKWCTFSNLIQNGYSLVMAYRYHPSFLAGEGVIDVYLFAKIMYPIPS